VSRDCTVRHSRPQQPHAWECGPAGAGQAQAVGRDVFVDVLQGYSKVFGWPESTSSSPPTIGGPAVRYPNVVYLQLLYGTPPKTSWRSGSRTAVRRLSTPDVLVDVLLTALRYLGPQESWVPGRAVSTHRCYKAVMPLNDQQEHVSTSANT
jgi:hypothetical protein